MAGRDAVGAGCSGGKHWLGHGQAANTHDRAATTTPPVSTLEQRDLLPFADLLRTGMPAVMVGHLNVPGLTEHGVPATLSLHAYRYLRERTGADRLLMTDSLNMGAISIGMRLSPGQAAVRALTAGADVVLVDPGAGPGPVIDAVSAALARGSYPRASPIASARRVLAVKRTTNAPLPMTSLTPAQATRDASLTPTLSGIARDRVGGTLTARFPVRTAGVASWNVANGAAVAVTSGSRASYRLGEAGCNTARSTSGACGPATRPACAPRRARSCASRSVPGEAARTRRRRGVVQELVHGLRRARMTYVDAAKFGESQE